MLDKKGRRIASRFAPKLEQKRTANNKKSKDSKRCNELVKDYLKRCKAPNTLVSKQPIKVVLVFGRVALSTYGLWPGFVRSSLRLNS